MWSYPQLHTRESKQKPVGEARKCLYHGGRGAVNVSEILRCSNVRNPVDIKGHDMPAEPVDDAVTSVLTGDVSKMAQFG